MLKKLFNDCTIEMKLETVDPMLVKSGLATVNGPNMSFVRTYRSGYAEPYIPGSSLKGVLRSHAERIARTLRSPSACEPFWNEEIKKEVQRNTNQRAETMWCGEKFNQREKSFDEEINNQTAYKESCPACRFFGSTFYSGRFAISDAYLIEEDPRQWRLEMRDGVGIDRYTGGASSRAKFDLEVLTNARFKFTIQISNFELWQLGWMAYTLQDLKDKLIQVGSAKTRGLGRVKGTVESVTVGYVVLNENELRDETGLPKLRGIGSLMPDPNYGLNSDDEVSLPADYAFARPAGKLRFEHRFENGQDQALWLACAPQWERYITNYQVAPRMLHTRFMNARRGEDDHG